MEKKINSIAAYLFIAVAFLTPLIFSPFPLISFEFSKIIPLVLVVILALFAWIIQSFNEGKIVFPWHLFFAAAVAVPASYVISAIFSVSRSESLLGIGNEVGTAAFIVLSFVFMYLVSLFVRSKDKIFFSYAAIAVAFLILAVFHTLRLFFGADFLSFGIFVNVISNTVGRWTDMAIFAGVAALLSLMSVEFLRLNKVFNIVAYVVLAFSVFLLAVTNFPIIVWGQSVGASISIFTLIGLFALVFFVYFISSSYGDQTRKQKIPPASLAVLIIAVVFTLGAGTLQPILSSFFKVEPVSEARLLWQPTASLSWSTLSNLPWYRPLIGNGPEQFSYKWMLNKPAGINDSVVWNTPFENGTGFILSSIVTVGLLGFLSWLAFLAFFGILGFKALFVKFKDPFSQYITSSSFLVALFLWITQIFYIPSIFSMIMTFFFSGLFLASLFREKMIKEREFVFENSKEKSFASIMGLIIFLIAVLFFGYKFGERVAASVYANKADMVIQTATSIEDVDRAEIYLENAASLNPAASYFRVLANLSLAEVNTILEDDSTPVEELRTKFQNTYGQTLNYARGAVAANPKDFDNYVVLGNVLERVVSLDVPDAYENAKIAYEEARKLNPNSPLIPYLLARLEVDHKNIDAAKEQIADALELKPYYLDAIILLGRIQLGEGNTQDALTSFTVAQSIDPNNQDIADIIRQIKGGQIRAPEIEEDNATTTDEEEQ